MSNRHHDPGTEPKQDDEPLADRDLDAVNGGILSSGHTTGVRSGTQKSTDDSLRNAPRDRDGKIIWQEIDGV